tara:strand:- start:366 stop:1481 length:1116 start_codon:yes stop_codon:yes gene_type:complete
MTDEEQPGITALSEQLDQQVTEYRAADAAIETMQETYGGLTITDIEDKKTVKVVVEAHRMVKAYRVKISKRGKELRAPATAFGKAVLVEEKRLIALIEPLETHLDNERDKLRAAERAAKEAEEKAAAEQLQARIDAMAAVGATINLDMLKNINSEMFALELRAAKEAEAERVAEESRRAEAGRLTEEAARIVREAAEKERGRLAREIRMQQAELQRLKQAEAQRVAAERVPAKSPPYPEGAMVTHPAPGITITEHRPIPMAAPDTAAVNTDEEHWDRLTAMTEPDQQTWDLSPKDVAAIQWAMHRMETTGEADHVKPTKHEAWFSEIISTAAALATDSNLLSAELETTDLKWLAGYANRLKKLADEIRAYS